MTQTMLPYHYVVSLKPAGDRFLFLVITKQDGTVIDEYKTALTITDYSANDLDMIADYFAKKYVWPTQNRVKVNNAEGYVPAFDAAASFLDDNFAQRILKLNKV